jgi:hypothetical protein
MDKKKGTIVRYSLEKIWESLSQKALELCKQALDQKKEWSNIVKKTQKII